MASNHNSGSWVNSRISTWPIMQGSTWFNHVHWAVAGNTGSGGNNMGKQANHEQFAGRDFDLAVGEMYGLRQWNIDEYGRLTPRNWKSDKKKIFWRPGVNIAECLASNTHSADIADLIDPTGAGRVAVHVSFEAEQPAIALVNSSIVSGAMFKRKYVVTWNDGTQETYDTLKWKIRTHGDELPNEECGCGFYAYTDPFHDELATYGTSMILGVIRGFGRTLIGSRGFRCEKAEIIAFRDPTRGGTKNDPWRLRQLAHLKKVYPDVPLLKNREALLEYAPLSDVLPDPKSDDFWAL